MEKNVLELPEIEVPTKESESTTEVKINKNQIQKETEPEIPESVKRKIESLQNRIKELEAQLKRRSTTF